MSKIPHWIYPSFWGLKGKAKEKAIAEYYLTGEELDNRLIDIEFDPNTTEYKEQKLVVLKKYKKINDLDFDLKMLDIKFYNHNSTEYNQERLSILKNHNQIDDFEYDIEMLKNKFFNQNTKEFKQEEIAILRKHDKISEQDYDFAMLELLDHNSDEYKRGVLDTELKYNLITQREYKKNILTLDNEEYFEIVKGEYNPESGILEFEFDWNPVFVENLINNGFKGQTASDVVNEWFNDVARQIYAESIGEPEDETQIESIMLKRNPLDGGFAEYN